MAEWILLILVFAVIGGTWLITRYLYALWQNALAWVIAALIISIALFFYGASKVEKASSNWIDRYEQFDEPL